MSRTILSVWTDPSVLADAEAAAAAAGISRNATIRAALSYGLRELAGQPEVLKDLAGTCQKHRRPKIEIP